MQCFKNLFFMFALCATVPFVSAELNVQQTDLMDELLMEKLIVRTSYKLVLNQGYSESQLEFATQALAQAKAIEISEKEGVVSYDFSDLKKVEIIINDLKKANEKLNKLYVPSRRGRDNTTKLCIAGLLGLVAGGLVGMKLGSQYGLKIKDFS